ncbi:MAG: type II secretion system protein [Verrucomicrobiota bacterium JB024]|nr:type II secretion system protein [Verrucomicrobiota bacterium JB024]
MPPRSSTPFRGRSAFTLIELLAVIAVVALLAGLLFSALTHVRAMAQQAQCANNLRELARLAQLQSAENGGRVPQGMWYYEGSVARPNLWDYGMTEELIQCASTELPRSYGINLNVIKPNNGTNWGGSGDPNFWKYGAYGYDQLDPVKTVLFADTFHTTTGYYYVNSVHADYRHGDKMQVSYVDGHVGLVTREEVEVDQILQDGLPN